MIQTKTGSVRELKSVLYDAADGLSPDRVAALVAHPEAVRSALAVMADVLSSERAGGTVTETIKGEKQTRVGTEEANRLISTRRRPGGRENLITSDELAARVGLKTRQSVHDWLRKGKIVGWRGAKRGYVFPAEQLDGRCRPLEGLQQVVAQFEDGYAAWVWLTTPRPSLGGAKPLALLTGGESDRVVAAVRGDRQGDFA